MKASWTGTVIVRTEKETLSQGGLREDWQVFSLAVRGPHQTGETERRSHSRK